MADKYIVTSTQTGIVDCATPFSRLLKDAGGKIEEVKLAYTGNTLQLIIKDSAGVSHTASIDLPIPNRAEENANGQLEFKDSTGKVLFTTPRTCLTACTP